MTASLDKLTSEQREALLHFRDQHGRSWKNQLLDGWLRAAYPGPLQQIRNSLGPEWLSKVREADFLPDDHIAYKVRKDASRNMVMLEHGDRVIEFGGIPAILNFAEESADVPQRIINELLAREGGYEGIFRPSAGSWEQLVGIRHGDPRKTVTARTEDDVWRAAAREAVTRYHLPDMCFIFMEDAGPGSYVKAVRRGEPGCFATTYDEPDTKKAEALVAHMNRKLGVSELQAECMLAGSMFGWDTLGADPERLVAKPAALGCMIEDEEENSFSCRPR